MPISLAMDSTLTKGMQEINTRQKEEEAN